jgi:hypothetical protein
MRTRCTGNTLCGVSYTTCSTSTYSAYTTYRVPGEGQSPRAPTGPGRCVNTVIQSYSDTINNNTTNTTVYNHHETKLHKRGTNQYVRYTGDIFCCGKTDHTEGRRCDVVVLCYTGDIFCCGKTDHTEERRCDVVVL